MKGSLGIQHSGSHGNFKPREAKAVQVRGMPSDQAAEPKVLPEPKAIAMTTGPAPERMPAQEVRKTVSIRRRTMSSDNYLRPNPKRAKATSSGPATPEAREPRSGARKTVTILFTDIVDSSRLGLSLDPEALRNLLTRYFDELSAVVQRHGGIVEKYIGDAIMAVFGVPLHEDDALRAVRAAAEMRDTLAILNHELEAGWGVRLMNRIGINTGEVIAGDNTREHLSVAGEAVNVAKRLEEAATANEILIGESTHRLVRDAVVVVPSGPRTAQARRDHPRPRRGGSPRPRPRSCAPLRLAFRRARTPASLARDRLRQRGRRQDLPPA